MPCRAIIESVTGVGNTVSHDGGNHIVRSLYEADTQLIKGVLVITGEAGRWAVQIGTCIKLRSNYTYSDTSKCISNGNMVLTLGKNLLLLCSIVVHVCTYFTLVIPRVLW